MKALSKKLLIFALCAVLSMAAVTAFAFGTYDIHTDTAVHDAQELELVKQAVLASPMIAPSDDFKNDGGLEAAIDFSGAYKVYDMNCEYLSGVESNMSLADMTAETYVWYIPAQNSQTVKVINTNGAWTVESITKQPESGENSAAIDLTALQAITDKLAKTHDVGGMSAVILDDTFSHYTNYVYLKGNDFEYIIPYSARTDLTGLVNGKHYTPAEFNAICGESFAKIDEEAAGIVTGETVGGAQNTETDAINCDNNTTAWIIVICAAAAAAIAVACVVAYKKKKA